MKIGVIITVYNLEKFVADAIGSVLVQSRPADDIIVIDDGSSDGSIDEILKFSGVKVIRNEHNRGVLPSIIEGLRSLNTDVVAFLDGDDRWHRDKLKLVEEEFDRSDDTMIVTHSYRWIDEHNRQRGVVDETHRNLSRIVTASKGNRAQMDILLKESILSYKGVWLGSAFTIRRRCLDLEGFTRWSESIEGHGLSHQDQPLAAWLIRENPSAKIVYLHQHLFDYRVFGENTSGNTRSLEKALFTIDRSMATIRRTRELVRSMPDRTHELVVQNNKYLELEYLRALYTNEKHKSLKIFLLLSRSHWNLSAFFKELKRFVAISVLGRRVFFRLKSKMR